jgi:hypothetical protein
MPPTNMLQSSGPAMGGPPPQGMPGGAMPASGPGMPQGAPGAPQGQGAPPTLAPTHAQTVAGLHHFQAIENQLRVLMQNPKFGKDDIKSEVLDGFVRLIGSQDMKPTEAVETIKDFPVAPVLQKQWVEQKFMAVNQARQLMLAHRQAAAAQEDPNAPPAAAWSADNHADHMTGLLGHYKSPAPGA